VLDQARPNSIFDVVAAPVLDDDRFNALEVEKPCKHKAGWACPDDTDLRAHVKFLPLVFL
jgi:hypothetical protein